MKFSLLYRQYDDEARLAENPLAEDMSNAIYDLSIDKAVNAFCRNKESFQYFMEALKAPLTDVEDIKYRQDILLDFIAMPKLLEELRLIFKSYDSLQSDWHEMRSSIYVYGVPNTTRGILDATYESLKVTAGFARSTVSYFRSIHDTIEKYEVKSEGLRGIQSFCAEMTENASLDEIGQISACFQRDTVDAYAFKIRAETDDTLQLRRASLTEAVELTGNSLGKSLKKLFGGLGKGGQQADTGAEIDMGEFHLEDAQTVLNEALYELYLVLSGITGNIYEFFRGLSGELSFYDTGLKLCRYLSAAGMPMCMPKLLPMEADTFRANDLYDIQLLIEGLGRDEIVTNGVRIEQDMDGMLIRGTNSSGKTAYVRAIGTTQIFAQAGLPVCASAANISVRSAVFTQFSSSEKDFHIGDVAGRFEGEVQEMAQIMDHLQPCSLVLLNETFQTTAYSEGAEGMRHILAAIARSGSKYVFVTRLLHLFANMDPARVRMVEFGAEGSGAYALSRIPMEKQHGAK